MNRNNVLTKFFLPLLLLTSGITKAQLVGTEAFLQGSFVEVGIATNGAFGSGTDAPAGYHPRGVGNLLGFVADPGKDGWTVGTPNYIGDYFLPGSPQEGWDVQYNNIWAQAWRGSGATSFTGGLTGACTGYAVTGSRISATWEGSTGPLAIRQVTTLRTDKLYFITKVTIKNTSSSTVNNVYYERTVDPDNEVAVPGGGSYTTINKFEFKLPNKSMKTLVSGTGEAFGAYLGLGTKDCRAKPYIVKASLTPGDSLSTMYKTNGVETDNALLDIVAPDTAYIADVGIGVIFSLGNLGPGDSTNLSYAYVLSTADLDSAFADISPVWEYDGVLYESGDTVKLCRDKAAPNEIKDLNIAYGSGYSWTWSYRPDLKNLTGTDNEITLTNTPQTYVAKPSEAFGCIDSMVITIMPYINPDPPTVVSPLEYCRFKAAPALTASGMAGAKMRYYTVASGGTASDKIIPNTNTPGTYTFYVSQLNGICESGRTPITVIVRPIPLIDSFTYADPTTCGGKEGWIQFKVDEASATYTVDYDLDGKAQPSVTLTSNAAGYIRLTGLQGGSYAAFKVTNKYGCVSNTYFGPLKLDGPHAVAPIVKNNGPLCAGDLAMLITTPKDSTTYLWKGPDGFTSTDPNPTFITKITSAGVYTLVTNKNSCISDPATTTLVIAPDPKSPELPDMAICEGQTLLAEVLAEPNTTYTWTGGGDDYLFSSGTTGNLKRENSKLNYAGQYILEAVNEIGCKTNDTIYVTIDTLIQLSVSKDTLMCAKDVITLYANTNAGSVRWSPSTGLSDSMSRNPGVSPGQTTTYTVTATTNLGVCPSVSAKVKVEVIPAPSVTGLDTLVRMNIPYKIMPAYGQNVVKWQWVPADSLSCSDCPNPVFNSSKDTRYVVYVADQYGCKNMDTVMMRVFCDGANITMPNAFTPNADGTNDVFYVRGSGFSVKSFRIYNRLGQLVFSRDNFMPNDPAFGWDGTFNGQPVSDAAGFAYMLEAVCFNSTNEPILIKGAVLMIK